MADRGDTHYSTPALNKWFLVSSVLMLGSFVWMMLHDFNRPWKVYQREFRQIEIAQVERQEQALEKAGALETESKLKASIAEAQIKVDARSADLAAARAELTAAKADLWNATEAAKKRKAEFNFERFKVEDERIARGDPTYAKEAIETSERDMNAAIGVQQVKETAKLAADQKVASLTKDVDDATKSLAAGTRDLERLRKRLDQLAPTKAPEKIANVIRDEVPGLDFIKPTLKVNKVVLDNLTFELNFTKKKRIDMCHTCHLGIDRAGFEGEEQPFKTHPRLDLYLTAKSPHPIKDIGCSICHRGSGEALDFVRADHRPSDEAQAVKWEDEHGWHKQHHWDYPMLANAFTEASCVQCHKTSMELIADDAPHVTKGYRLVEQYGCYACHKIDWFPTKRRPGPTLQNIQAKVSPEFITAWVTDPKSFRPTTWMPQFFHLENYAPGEKVVDSKYGTGRAIEGREWDDASIAAVVAFLQSRAPKQALDPIPVKGDAHRGREVMRLVGCLACHNMAPFGDEAPKTRDMALERRGTNEHGPNLRGVATKINAEWLYHWIKDPQGYWPDTRMPNLRLDDQDAADITSYVMDDPDAIFHDTPKGWEPKLIAMPEPQMLEVLGEQARWYFAREGRATVEARLAGEDPKMRWNDLETLKVAVGEKVVGQYGCFSCHEISGLLDMMPIGTELSNWGSKTVDKLDFGFATLEHEYREGWLMQKLHEPRSFDQQKVKNPTERLRMPWFHFTDDQVQSIATFVVGLVDDEVQRAKMVPTPDKLAMDAGMRVVRQKNCMACHMVEPGKVTFTADDGHAHTITAELLAFEGEPVPSAHDLEAVKKDLAAAQAEEVGLRVLRAEPEIGKGIADKVFVKPDKLLALTPPRGGDFIRLVTDYYFHGIELYDPKIEKEEDRYSSATGAPQGETGIQEADGKFRDHTSEPYDKIRWTFAPPVLWDEGGKVQRDWLFAFLNDVVPIRPQLRVRMPSFHFNAGEAGSVADYFAQKSAKDWPPTYARELRRALNLSAADVAKGANIDVAIVTAIENGSAPDIKANFSKVLAFGQSKGFAYRAQVNPAYEASELRAQAYLDKREVAQPGHLDLGGRLATEAVNCFQCHFRLGEPPPADPIAWAPDIARVHERLRDPWVLGWLRNPGVVYPGTAMPANFSGDPPQYQDRYPNSTNEQQLRVVLEWLYNFDRVTLGLGKTLKTAQK
jgi:cytochrome c2